MQKVFPASGESLFFPSGAGADPQRKSLTLDYCSKRPYEIKEILVCLGGADQEHTPKIQRCQPSVILVCAIGVVPQKALQPNNKLYKDGYQRRQLGCHVSLDIYFIWQNYYNHTISTHEKKFGNSADKRQKTIPLYISFTFGIIFFYKNPVSHIFVYFNS